MAEIKKTELRVNLIHRTPHAERILSFAKDTRLLGDCGSYPLSVMMSRPMDEVMENVRYSMNTIRGPLEFIHFIFLITNATRALQQQVTRHRTNSYAIQSMRLESEIGYYLPQGITGEHERNLYEAQILNSKEAYDTLIANGVQAQDARNLLPMGSTSAIMMKINLRNLLEYFEVRHCLRVQGEHRDMSLMMADIAESEFPWIKPHIGPLCAVKGICAFPRYDCPISRKHPVLKGPSDPVKDSIKKQLAAFGSKGLAIGSQKTDNKSSKKEYERDGRPFIWG